jgi:hypothetical protein
MWLQTGSGSRRHPPAQPAAPLPSIAKMPITIQSHTYPIIPISSITQTPTLISTRVRATHILRFRLRAPLTLTGPEVSTRQCRIVNAVCGICRHPVVVAVVAMIGGVASHQHLDSMVIKKYQLYHPEHGLVARMTKLRNLAANSTSTISGPPIANTYRMTGGTPADIRGNGRPNGIPRDSNYADQYECLGYCRDLQAVDARIELIGKDNQYIHCRWPF